MIQLRKAALEAYKKQKEEEIERSYRTTLSALKHCFGISIRYQDLEEEDWVMRDGDGAVLLDSLRLKGYLDEYGYYQVIVRDLCEDCLGELPHQTTVTSLAELGEFLNHHTSRCVECEANRIRNKEGA